MRLCRSQLIVWIAVASTAAAQSKDTAGLTDDVIAVRISSFSTLIMKERDSTQRNAMLISRGQLYLQRVRNHGSDASKATGSGDMKAALQDFNLVSADTKAPAASRALADYLIGRIEAEMNHNDKAAAALERSLTRDPKSSYAGGIVLFLGDLEMQKGHYKKAVALYKDHMAAMPEAQRVTAVRAMALCEFGMKKRPYASRAHFAAFQRFRKETEKLSVNDPAAVLESPETTGPDALQRESEDLLKAYAATFFHRAKNPENIGKAELGQSLRTLYTFYSQHWSGGPQRQQMFQDALQVCADLEDNACISDTVSAALKDESLKSVWQKAAVYRIEALENLTAQNSDKYKPVLVQALKEYTSDPNAPKARQYSGRYAELSGDRPVAVVAQQPAPAVPPAVDPDEPPTGDEVTAAIDAFENNDTTPVAAAADFESPATTAMRQGHFAAAEKLSVRNKAAISKDLLYESILARFGNFHDVSDAELIQLPLKQRESVLMILALTKPERVRAYGGHVNNKSKTAQLQSVFLAVQILQKNGRALASVPAKPPLKWPNSLLKPTVAKLVQDKNYTGALITVELQKSVLPPEDYYGFRVAILSSKSWNAPIANFLRAELEAAGQKELLQQWPK